jgi:hypothetical protein
MTSMGSARVARPIDHLIEIYIQPSLENQRKALAIRSNGGEVPPHMQPRKLGVFTLGRTHSMADARRMAQEKASELAKQHGCVVRTVNRGQRCWTANLTKSE